MSADVADRPVRTRPRPVPARVRAIEQLTESMVRVVVHADDWSSFGEPEHADAYVKLVFLSPGIDYPRPIDPALIRAELPAEHWPRTRTYTVRAFDRDRGELTLDIVTHGTSGLAGLWAQTARPGDEIHISGPGGGYSPREDADWHLLVGDESALPAIAVALERLPRGASATAFVEVGGSADEIDLPRRPGIDVRWLYRGGVMPGTAVVAAVRNWAMPDGNGQFFVHGEAAFVRDLRRYLRVERKVPLASLSISGYWRLGADDEDWRRSKRAWNEAIEASESAAT